MPHPAQYDPFADEYEQHASEAPYNALYDRPATLALAGDVRGRRVLDAGCGPGLYLQALLRSGAHAQGCDASERMIELTRRRVGPAVDLHVHSLDRRLGWLDDDSIDLVVCALAYHYVNDRRVFLDEVLRVLAPGGRLVISTHHPTADWVRLGGSYFQERTVTERWSTGWEVTTWRLPLTTLCAEFADAGFVIERLVEPLPDPAMAVSHPATHERLSTEPAFILFALTAAAR